MFACEFAAYFQSTSGGLLLFLLFCFYHLCCCNTASSRLLSKGQAHSSLINCCVYLSSKFILKVIDCFRMIMVDILSSSSFSADLQENTYNGVLVLVKLLSHACNLTKEGLYWRCFPVNFANNLNIAFFKRTLSVTASEVPPYHNNTAVAKKANASNSKYGTPFWWKKY